MKVNQKAVKVLEKLFDAKYTNERAISSLTIDQMAISSLTIDQILALKGVTIPDIAMVNELQKKIRGHEVLSFFWDEPPKPKEPPKHEEPPELPVPYDMPD